MTVVLHDGHFLRGIEGELHMKQS